MNNSLTQTLILESFTESIQDTGGTIRNTQRAGQHLFVRALLPDVQQARPNDAIQAGVAMRANDLEVCVYPYLLREVCSNGAVMGHAIESLQVDLHPQMTQYQIEQEIRDAVLACSHPEVFNQSMNVIRQSVHTGVDIAIGLIALMDHVPATIWEMIFARFERQEPTRFALMNSVTSVARDTPDPELKWRLEELGGGIGAGIMPTKPYQPQGRHVDSPENLELHW